MSISNTNINYSITDKVSQTIDSGLIGDPNKITLSKNAFKKLSIYKDASNWFESNQSVNITQKIDPELNYQH